MRNNKGQFIHNKWKNWRMWVIILTILSIVFLSNRSSNDTTQIKQPDVFMKPVVVDHPEDESVETKIRKYFPRSHVTMLAIAHAESNLNHEAQNWNCYYYKGKATTTPIKNGSKSCLKEDRHLSWSIDCGVLMKNYIGIKECPNVPIDEHLQEMAELSKKRHFQPWSAYNNGRYLQWMPKSHLANNN